MSEIKINTDREELQISAFEAIKKAGFVATAQLVTGGGKAKILIDCLKYLKPTGAIWFLTDSRLNRDKTFKDEMIKWGAEEWIDKVEFMCYQTAYKRKGFDVELVLADEVDVVSTQYIKALTNNNFKYKILATATINPDKKALIESVAPIVFKRELKDVEGLGIVNESKYYIVKYMLTARENAQYLKYNAIFSSELNKPKKDVKKIQFIQIQRNLFLSKLESSVKKCRELLEVLTKDKRRKILIFCGLSTQADKVCRYSYHGKNEKNDNLTKFNENKVRTLSVVAKIDRGANIDGINTQIFESPKKSQTKWQQKSGRGRRLAVDEVLDIFYLVPYYRDKFGKLKPTIVESWVFSSAGSLNIKPEIYNL